MPSTSDPQTEYTKLLEQQLADTRRIDALREKAEWSSAAEREVAALRVRLQYTDGRIESAQRASEPKLNIREEEDLRQRRMEYYDTLP